jgi:hypothetical protein
MVFAPWGEEGALKGNARKLRWTSACIWCFRLAFGFIPSAIAWFFLFGWSPSSASVISLYASLWIFVLFFLRIVWRVTPLGQVSGSVGLPVSRWTISILLASVACQLSSPLKRGDNIEVSPASKPPMVLLTLQKLVALDVDRSSIAPVPSFSTIWNSFAFDAYTAVNLLGVFLVVGDSQCLGIEVQKNLMFSLSLPIRTMVSFHG